jgi:hypothetical protein
MRVHIHLPHPKLFNLDESKKAAKANTLPILSYSTWMRVKMHSPYPGLFNLDESKDTLALSQVIQLG